MRNKKIISIIALSGIVAMNTQTLTSAINSNKITSKNYENTHNDNKTRSSNTNMIQISRDKLSNGIQNNIITINNVWNQNIGSLKFNPETLKMEFVNGWAETNPYASKTEEVFSISLYKSNGELIKSVQVHGDEYPEQKLDNVFNNLNYTYGDILEINYKISSKISISNFNNEKTYQVNKPISM